VEGILSLLELWVDGEESRYFIELDGPFCLSTFKEQLMVHASGYGFVEDCADP
jgi:hypothetical protein